MKTLEGGVQNGLIFFESFQFIELSVFKRLFEIRLGLSFFVNFFYI
jgi:hypothetical protein